ncbi:NitT/TauT family transport system substrate-binding protein [Thermosporothrix hazakensis]|uniref:NitT/TauT family transport system substrate-binding protein n=2 Tax=Thermosporothrix TaxID=768650 RepID=A0A326UIW5_THEHA|nr:ABC transporter substrate-binding protein [Thermosporothrix hazakensis]PZW32068.1 NitT/TauT family transport system substrate-binding protein [Thermosporothrix hazakensis]BBH91459.1 riboflavin-binding protein RibY [Thermosporothrix sp. COM3]GCE49604.1 riboflavin-binding protein RibY [Thermosporothrix hazakensis]
MFVRRRISALSSALMLVLALGLLLAACGGATSTGAGSPATPAPGAKKVSIGLGYVPDVQFSPFYVAKSKGYYNEVGLDVTFNHGIVPDLVGSMVAGKNTFVFVSGDELLTAREKKVNAVNVGTIFQKYPVSLIVPEDSSIKSLEDLKGHTIGVPGEYGASYVGLLALLYKAHLTKADVKIQSIGFTQVPALLAHRVDAIMGYSNNEPLQLQKRGVKVRTFAVSENYPLVSNGIVATEEMLRTDEKTVRAFVQATLKGLQDVIKNPEEAVTISKSYVPGLTDTAGALEVLKATIPTWQGKGKLGYNDPAVWEATARFMVDQKMISPVKDLQKAYTNSTVL